MTGIPGRRITPTSLVSALALSVLVLVAAACGDRVGSDADGGGTSIVPVTTSGSRSELAVPPVPQRNRVDDALAECPAASDIEFLIGEIDFVFDGDPTAPELVCRAADGSADLTRLQERAIQALLMMEATVFEEPLPWTDLQVFEWFTSVVDGIRFRDDLEMSFCCDPDGYINVQTGDLAALTTERWIDPSSGTGLIDLIALLVHEGRHSEGFVHTCDADDQTVAELGAWAVEALLYRWYADHADLVFFDAADHPGHYAQVAESNVDHILETRFCGD